MTEEEIYTILNEIITDDSVRFSSTLSATFEKSPLDRRAQNHFTSDDLKFIHRQIDHLSEMKIQPNKIKRTGWRVLQKRNVSPFAKTIPNRSDTILHCYFTFPIISADRKKVILKIGHGGGYMVGGHETYLFEKINSKWVLKDTWDIIIV